MTRKKTSTRKKRTGRKKDASCDKLLAMLSEYVDGGLKRCVCDEIEAHLADCSPCRVVVDNVRKTIMLYRGAEPCEIPEAIRSRLHECLRAKWKTSTPKRK